MPKRTPKYMMLLERYHEIGRETGKEAFEELSPEAIERVLADYPGILRCSDGTFHGALLAGDDEELCGYWYTRYEEDPVLRSGDGYGRLSEAAYQHLVGWYEAIEEAAK